MPVISHYLPETDWEVQKVKVSPTPRSGEGSEKAERTRVPLTTKHRGILSYVSDDVLIFVVLFCHVLDGVEPN